MIENRKFIIFSMTEINKINFSEVLETSADTLRKSVDGTKSFVKWESEEEPSFISSLQTKEGPFTFEEMIQILATNEWTYPIVH